MAEFVAIGIVAIVEIVIFAGILYFNLRRSCPEKWKQQDYDPPPSLALQLKRDRCLLDAEERG